MSNMASNEENARGSPKITLCGNLTEMFLQCFELQDENVETLSLAQLSLMFCRSPFAENQTNMEDSYGESIQVWMLANPLCLKRYLQRFPEIFSIAGVWVTRTQKPTNKRNQDLVPVKVHKGVQLLRTIFYDEPHGILTLDSIVENIEKVVSSNNSSSQKKSRDYSIFGNPISKNRVKSLIKACFSQFKLESNTLLEIATGIGCKQDNEPIRREYELLRDESEEKSGLSFIEETLIKNKRSMSLGKLQLTAFFAEESPECLKVSASDKYKKLFNRLVNRKESFLIKDRKVFLICSDLEREIIGEIQKTLRKTWGISDMTNLAAKLGESTSNFYSKLRKANQTWQNAPQNKTILSPKRDLSFFLLKFSWIFEVKTNPSKDVSKYTVFLLERQDSQILYRMLDSVYKKKFTDEEDEKMFSSAVSHCIKELQQRNGKCSLQLFREHILQSQNVRKCGVESLQDTLNFLAIFPAIFKISDGFAWLAETFNNNTTKDLETATDVQSPTRNIQIENLKNGMHSAESDSSKSDLCQISKENTYDDRKKSERSFSYINRNIRMYKNMRNNSRDFETIHQKQEKSENVSNIEMISELRDCDGEETDGSFMDKYFDGEKSSQQNKYCPDHNYATTPNTQQVDKISNSETFTPAYAISYSENYPVEKSATDDFGFQLEMEMFAEEEKERRQVPNFQTNNKEFRKTKLYCADNGVTAALSSDECLSWTLMKQPLAININGGQVFIDFSQPLNFDSGPFVKLDHLPGEGLLQQPVRQQLESLTESELSEVSSTTPVSSSCHCKDYTADGTNEFEDGSEIILWKVEDTKRLILDDLDEIAEVCRTKLQSNYGWMEIREILFHLFALYNFRKSTHQGLIKVNEIGDILSRFPSIFKLTVDKKCAMLVELITKEKERFHQPGLCEIVKFVIKRLEEEGNAMLTKRLCNQLSQMRGKQQFQLSGVKKGKLAYTLLLVESFPSVFSIKGFKENVSKAYVVLRKNWKDQLFRNRFSSKMVAPVPKSGAVPSYADMVKEKQKTVFEKGEASAESASVSYDKAKSASNKEEEVTRQLTEYGASKEKTAKIDAELENAVSEETMPRNLLCEKQNVCFPEREDRFQSSYEKFPSKTKLTGKINCKEISVAVEVKEGVFKEATYESEYPYTSTPDESKQRGNIGLLNEQKRQEDLMFATAKVNKEFPENNQDISSAAFQEEKDYKFATVCFSEEQPPIDDDEVDYIYTHTTKNNKSKSSIHSNLIESKGDQEKIDNSEKKMNHKISGPVGSVSSRSKDKESQFRTRNTELASFPLPPVKLTLDDVSEERLVFLNGDHLIPASFIQDRSLIEAVYGSDALQMKHNQEERLFLEVFPPDMQTDLHSLPAIDYLIEVTMNVGCYPLARFFDPRNPNQQQMKTIGSREVTAEGITKILCSPVVGRLSTENKAYMKGTLHSISTTKNQMNHSLGISVRYGRAVYGVLDIVFDLICGPHSILILGKAESGKKSVLREFSRVLSESCCNKVLVIDPTGQMGGELGSSHQSLGSATRIHPQDGRHQFQLVSETIVSGRHDVLIVDKILSNLCRSEDVDEYILHGLRKTRLIASSDDEKLKDLVKNQRLKSLIAGSGLLQPDESDRRREKPMFDLVIEMKERNKWLIYPSLQEAVTRLAAQKPINVQVRQRRKRRNHEGTTILINTTQLEPGSCCEIV